MNEVQNNNEAGSYIHYGQIRTRRFGVKLYKLSDGGLGLDIRTHCKIVFNNRLDIKRNNTKILC